MITQRLYVTPTPPVTTTCTSKHQPCYLHGKHTPSTSVHEPPKVRHRSIPPLPTVRKSTTVQHNPGKVRNEVSPKFVLDRALREPRLTLVEPTGTLTSLSPTHRPTVRLFVDTPDRSRRHGVSPPPLFAYELQTHPPTHTLPGEPRVTCPSTNDPYRHRPP